MIRYTVKKCNLRPLYFAQNCPQNAGNAVSKTNWGYAPRPPYGNVLSLYREGPWAPSCLPLFPTIFLFCSRVPTRKSTDSPKTPGRPSSISLPRSRCQGRSQGTLLGTQRQGRSVRDAALGTQRQGRSLPLKRQFASDPINGCEGDYSSMRALTFYTKPEAIFWKRKQVSNNKVDLNKVNQKQYVKKVKENTVNPL